MVKMIFKFYSVYACMHVYYNNNSGIRTGEDLAVFFTNSP